MNNIRAAVIVDDSVTINIRRQASKDNRVGKDMTVEEAFYQKMKIGASLTQGGQPLKGLTFAEESLLLPSIISVNPDDINFQGKAKDYWNNISKEVPFKGLKLDISMRYKSQEGADRAEAERLRELEIYNAERAQGRHYVRKFDVQLTEGYPLNIDDYVLWRYCLVYNHVANSIEEVGNSNRIRFFLSSKKEIEAAALSRLDIEDKAMSEYFATKADAAKVKAVIILMKDKIDQRGWKDMNESVVYKKLAEDYPVQFFGIANDKNLKGKRMIIEAINANILRYLGNTEIVMFGDEQLGANIEQAVETLKSDEETLTIIKHRLEAYKNPEGVAPVIPLEDPVGSEETNQNPILKEGIKGSPNPDGSGASDDAPKTINDDDIPNIDGDDQN